MWYGGEIANLNIFDRLQQRYQSNSWILAHGDLHPPYWICWTGTMGWGNCKQQHLRHTTTQMGSGYLPSNVKSAYIRDLHIAASLRVFWQSVLYFKRRMPVITPSERSVTRVSRTGPEHAGAVRLDAILFYFCFSFVRLFYVSFFFVLFWSLVLLQLIWWKKLLFEIKISSHTNKKSAGVVY